jgi:hypothetical protein
MGAYLEMLDVAMLLWCSISHLSRFAVLSSYKKSSTGTREARSNISVAARTSTGTTLSIGIETVILAFDRAALQRGSDTLKSYVT